MGSLGFTREDVVASLQAAAEGRFDVLIDEIMPLAHAAEAHRRVAGRAGLGKVILSPKLSA
jgi:hypothetical protein